MNLVATQLQQHPAASTKPSLLFTGHSAGGAVASILYSHMLSTSVKSDLTALVPWFEQIHCISFGAPPVSLTPLQEQHREAGVFLAFANEGDPVLRLSNTAYLKSLAKLIAAPLPLLRTDESSRTPHKNLRRRLSTLMRRVDPAHLVSHESDELPLWPVPKVPMTNAGHVVLLREEKKMAIALQVKPEDLRDVIFGDLAQHSMYVYMKRVQEMACSAIIGRGL